MAQYGKFKKGQVPWNKGLSYSTGKRTEEAKQKMSNAAKGKPKSEAHRKAISISQQKLSDEVKARKAHAVSCAQKGNTHRRGKHQIAWNKGKNTGQHSWNYKGNITKLDRLIRALDKYNEWRSDCFKRDNWTCQHCGIREVYLTVHHIKGFHRIIKENKITNTIEANACSELWDIRNGITLCEVCHTKTDNYKGRGKT